MDFVKELVEIDEGERTALIRLKPDPRRYEKIVQEGETFYLDKYLRYLIPGKEMMGQLGGLPVYSLSPSIDSTLEYANQRQAAVGEEIRSGRYSPPIEPAAKHEELDAAVDELDLVFLSVDVCGSSAHRRTNKAAFERALGILLRELGTLVGQFNGSILKLTGDGFIAYITHPAFTSRCDAAVDLGTSMRLLAVETLGRAFLDAGLPELQIRIGADHGRAEMRRVSIPTTGFEGMEISSDALNRAVKIEQSCAANEFRIGRDLYELIHVQWLERAVEIKFDGEQIGQSDYRCYSVT